MKLKTILFSLIFLFLCGPVFALELGTDITKYDNKVALDSQNWWNKVTEDQEVEPGMVRSQAWDLEGFFLNDNDLSIVGGFDFKDGKDGYESGDIFIDINGDAQYGIGTPGFTGTNVYGYDYVVDIDWSASTYDLLKIDDLTKVYSTYYPQNNTSNPWLYESGAVSTVKSGLGFDYYSSSSENALSDASTGFTGGSRNAAVFDLTELFSNLSSIGGWDGYLLTHFTMECGNDNLVGSAVVPEPATAVISSLFLIGAGLFVRRKLHGT